MKVIWGVPLILISMGFTQIKPLENQDRPFFQSSSGIRQIDKIIAELVESIGDIPPEVSKIAIYQIRTDPNSFSKGVARYIQGKVETALRDENRRKVISPPELRTLNIISTDSTFKIRNTIPTIGELWKLGDKLRIDAFVEGSCGKSKDGDVMLNLKLVKHRTAEILWSGDFIAGPNKIEPNIFDLKWSARMPVRVFKVESFKVKGSNLRSSPDDNDATEKIDNIGLNMVAFEANITEALTKNKKLWFSITTGFSRSGLAIEQENDLKYASIWTMQLGVGLWGVLVPKTNPDRGHWLGAYLNAAYYVPFLFEGSIPVVTHGYNAQLSKHFGIGAGISYILGDRIMTGTSSTSSRNGHKIKLEAVAYEVDILNYTF